MKNIQDLDVGRFGIYKFGDVFEVVPGPSHKASESSNSVNAIYPIIGASKDNLIDKCLDTYDYNEGYYTLAKNGNSAGTIHKQNQKFSKTGDVYVLNKLINFNDNINLLLITIQLNAKYDWTNKLNKDKFKDIEIYLYI